MTFGTTAANRSPLRASTTTDASSANDCARDTPGANQGDVYIASCLVDCMPPLLTSVLAAIAAIARASVYTHSSAGRIVVVLEAASSFAVVRAIDEIRALPGVVNLNMVYQHVESAAAMNEPLHQHDSVAQSESAQLETP